MPKPWSTLSINFQVDIGEAPGCLNYICEAGFGEGTCWNDCQYDWSWRWLQGECY